MYVYVVFLWLHIWKRWTVNSPFYSCVLSDLALAESEAGVDLVLIQTLLLFICRSCCSYASYFSFTHQKHWGLYQSKVNPSLTSKYPRPGDKVDNCKMAYSTLLAEASFQLYSLNWRAREKRDLCPGSKQTVLSMRYSYLATEPSCAGSLNGSRVTVNECARDSLLK